MWAAYESSVSRERGENGLMDAPSTGELDAELADLRRRAYGPDADIAEDAAAAARLRELERLRRPSEPPAPTGPEESPAHGAEPAPRERAERAAAADPAGDHGSADAQPITAVPWWRRPVVLAAAIAGVAGLVLGLVIPAGSAPHPARTLGVAGGAPPEAFSDDAVRQALDYLGVQPASMRELDRYGDIQPWIARAGQGSTCLLLSSVRAGLTGGFFGVSCTPPGVDWVVDVRLDGRTPMSVPDRSLRTGSLLRFQGSGDTVGLFITPAPPTRT
jgi:hypothetical protein